MMYVVSPDDIKSVMTSPFVALYWPLLVGVVVIMGFLFRGYTKTTIPVAAIALFIQAWHSGFFGAK